MITSAFRLAVFGLCAIVLSGCLAANPPAPHTRTIKFTYCTGPDGAVVPDPAAANAKGVPLSCFNFIAR